MKIHFIAFSLLMAATLSGYEVDIQKGPALDAGPNSYMKDFEELEDETPLLEFLGGEKEIKRILIGTPTMNANQIEFSEALVRTRISESESIDSKKDEWHYAPYSMGTIYWIDGKKQNFTMYLSGFSIGGHLFAIRKQPTE